MNKYRSILEAIVSNYRQPDEDARGISSMDYLIEQAETLLNSEDNLMVAANLALAAIEPDMEGDSAPHPDIAAAYNALYREVHGEPEPEPIYVEDLPL